MYREMPIFVLSLLLIIGFSTFGFAAKVPAPDKGGDGFKMVTLEEAKKLDENGATVVACHSHTTDFMKGHPSGTIHIPPKGLFGCFNLSASGFNPDGFNFVNLMPVSHNHRLINPLGGKFSVLNVNFDRLVFSIENIS